VVCMLPERVPAGLQENPFPFPWAQLVLLFLVFHTIMVPFMISAFINETWLSVVVTFMAVQACPIRVSLSRTLVMVYWYRLHQPILSLTLHGCPCVSPSRPSVVLRTVHFEKCSISESCSHCVVVTFMAKQPRPLTLSFDPKKNDSYRHHYHQCHYLLQLLVTIWSAVR
jgi:hypothetical protein